ncbi:zinc-binding dehydrogenase [Streptomyces polygonati]|uniref:2-deoxy-scyllo-inosamine dehydrogenase n=1 Tax=Streptomyces polygonati TaxID=1617087 RepID=A0ABV8HW95_9ACTN
MTDRHMRAARLTGVRRIQCTEIPVPEPGPDEMLVRVLATGVCGSDLAAYRGTHPYKRAPVVLGHELSAVVERLGSRVAGFAPGDMVCAAAFSHCGSCVHCRAGAVNLCGDKRSISHLDWSGSFAERAVLHQNMAYRLPARLDPFLGALVEPLSIGLHAMRLAGAARRRSVAVLGGGTIGLACVIAARVLGFGRTVCVDRGSVKGELALKAGADAFVDAGTAEPAAAALRELGGPAELVVVAAGYPGVVEQAQRLVAAGGSILVVSYFDTPVPVDLNALVGREVAVLGSALSTAGDFAEVIDWLDRGLVAPGFLISHSFALDEVSAAMELMDTQGTRTGKIMIRADTVDTADADTTERTEHTDLTDLTHLTDLEARR